MRWKQLPAIEIVGSRIANYTSPDTDESGVIVPYAGLVYDLNQNYSLFASYSSIFKPQSNQDEQGRVLDPLEGRSYEMGLKAEFLWADDEQWQAHNRLLFAQGNTDWRPVRWLKSDGQEVDALVYSELNEDPAGPLVLTTVVVSAATAEAGHERTIAP